jgi:acyl-CoA synthetase (AMP-forming)/AMP-acid ligase II
VNGVLTQLERHGSQIALVDEQLATTSYTQLLERAELAAAPFAGPRRVVMLEFTRSAAAIAAYIGLMRAGHVVMPFSPGDAARARTVGARIGANAMLRASGRELELEWLQRDELALHPELRLLMSTSGTTGSPKLVKLSRRNLDSNAAAIAGYLALSPGERAITTLPFQFASGLSVLNSHLYAGASLALSDASVVAPGFWPKFERLGATSFAGVPHMFEVLTRSDPGWAATKGLRHVAQTGGKLAPELVHECAKLGARHGWRLFVMYGQTEAAPRIAYLPPERVLEAPECVGVPVPGGEIVLLDEQGREFDAPEQTGELAYRGPNVMLGYALTPADLAVDATPQLLRTGDLAQRRADGLYRIVGRIARFVKIYGLRIHLDEVEAHLRELWPTSACSGDDERIVLALAGAPDAGRASRAVEQLARRYHLPPARFATLELAELPYLPNGKIDYRKILAAANAASAPNAPQDSLLSAVFSRRMLELTLEEGARLLGLGAPTRGSVAEIFCSVLALERVAETDTFASLAGDSLSYVDASVALEEHLGALPRGWERMSVAQLERLKADGAAL